MPCSTAETALWQKRRSIALMPMPVISAKNDQHKLTETIWHSFFGDKIDFLMPIREWTQRRLYPPRPAPTTRAVPPYSPLSLLRINISHFSACHYSQILEYHLFLDQDFLGRLLGIRQIDRNMDPTKLDLHTH